MELYDIETDSEVYKEGIFTDGFVEVKGGPDEMVGAVRSGWLSIWGEVSLWWWLGVSTR